jgi:MoaA/NifB/PqqE/SkfB family radical SAM enzyme
MAHRSVQDSLTRMGKGVRTYFTNSTMVVSYEVTLSCNCNCHHCDLGGYVENEKQIGPEQYADVTRRLKPLVAQISGGEPLLRKDIAAIVRAIKQSDNVPHVILVTNGVLLNESNYLELREAGVSQFSVSLDFPDERHDEFRRRPGLYRRLEQNLPRLAELGFHDIVLNSAITRANLKDILPLAKKAAEWKVGMSYSAYTALRTDNPDYSIKDEHDLEILRGAMGELLSMKRRGFAIVNPDIVLKNITRFFERGYAPNCKAGTRFLIVMPDGNLVPCSLHRYKYSNRGEMIRDFSSTNRCGGCYVAIRSYSELSLLDHLRMAPFYMREALVR